jgi:hypothetical protein
MRILVVTPVLRHISVCTASRRRALAVAALAGHDIIAVELPHHGPQTNTTLCATYNRARQLALQLDADALLTIEDDMIVPERAIAVLAGTPGDIVYSLYVWRRPPHDWSAYWHLEDDGGLSVIRYNPLLATSWLRAGVAVEMRGVGMGCTLIRRAVLERIAFRLDQGRAAPDWWLAYDARHAGFTQTTHFGVVCGHVLTRPALTVLWPDAEADGYVRREGIDAPADDNVLEALYA